MELAFRHTLDYEISSSAQLKVLHLQVLTLAVWQLG
jgi:hypothetical protein